MKLSDIKIENDKLVLTFHYLTYGIGDDITIMHDLKLWSDPKQVCEDLVNTANGIIDTLEPLMQQHRLIIDTNVVHKDYNSSNEMYSVEKALRFQLFYQKVYTACCVFLLPHLTFQVLDVHPN